MVGDMDSRHVGKDVAVMSDDNPILFGPDGWYDAITGERIDTARLGRENMEASHKAAMAGVGPNKTWEQAHDDAVKVVYTLARKLEVAMKWLDKIGSFAGERQRSATVDEDNYLHGVYDADTATRRL